MNSDNIPENIGHNNEHNKKGYENPYRIFEIWCLIIIYLKVER